MKKYTLNELRKLENLPTQHLKGLDKEVIAFFNVNISTVPMIIQAIGITNPTPDYSVFRNPGDVHVLEYVLSGKGHVFTDKKIYTVEEGDVYLLRCGSPQHYYADKTDPYKKIWINFNSKIFDSVFDQLNFENALVIRMPECKQDFEKLFSLANLSPNNEDICYEAASTVFKILLQISQKKNNRVIKNSFAEKIRMELDAAVYSTLNINDIATKLFVSRQHLSREFKKNYNESPYQYLINQKLLTAKNLLKYTELSVKIIANQLGFDDENHFSTLFKSKTNQTPTQYKNSLKIPSPPPRQ